MTRYERKHVTKVAHELAKQAGITPAQAMKVLEVLRIEKLVENMEGVQRIVSDRTLATSLGYYPEHAGTIEKALQPTNFRLKNFGLVFKTPDMLGSEVAV